MKKELGISILLVIIVIGGIFWSLQKKPTAPATSQVVPVEPTTKSSITTQEVMKHNTQDDCWVIVNSNVFNVTSYIPNHPGGPQQIISLCGSDATTAFDTKGGKGQHSPRAQAMLDTLLVGALQK